jgi:hypothetical protein
MHRTAIIAGSVVAALATGGVLAVSGGAQSPTGQTIKLVTKNCKFNFIDVPPKGKSRSAPPGSGDSAVFSCPAFDEAGARAGTLEATSTFTKGGKAARAVATGVYDLANGNIYASVLFSIQGSTTTGVITGGDGAYVGARGTIKTFDRPGEKGGDPSDDTLTLLP